MTVDKGKAGTFRERRGGNMHTDTQTHRQTDRPVHVIKVRNNLLEVGFRTVYRTRTYCGVLVYWIDYLEWGSDSLHSC